MIDEQFLQSAVSIRRQYLKVSNNLNMYHNRAKDVVNKLNMTLSTIDEMKNKLETLKNSNQDEQVILKELVKIMNDIEEEGNRLEQWTEPLNQEIEKLAIEEQNLYQKIKEKHTNLSDEQIIESVKQRLQQEGLS